MIEFVVMIVAVALLVIAFEPARRRANHQPPTARGDRDAERVRGDLAARDPEPEGVRRVAQLLARAGRAVPMHRAPLAGGLR